MALIIEQQVDLQPYNTFKVRASARYLARITSRSALIELISSPIFKENKQFILGGGSNVVFLHNFDGLIIKSEEKALKVVEENDREILINVSSGTVWHDLVLTCLGNNWGGIENLALIPGTVGAAPIQNIGAYGVEVKDVLKAVEVIALNTGEVHTLTNAECKFSYRESVFKHTFEKIFFISSITLRLTKEKHNVNHHYEALRVSLSQQNITSPTIHDIARTVIEIRQSKLPDPMIIGNAGSFFKNPIVSVQQLDRLRKSYPAIPSYHFENQLFKVPAGWLIESCGWKGKRIGDVGVHTNQALVIVNHHHASGEEIFNLSEQILFDVEKKFGLTLTREVNMID